MSYRKSEDQQNLGSYNLVVSHLCGKKCSMPFLLGEKVDAEVQTIIRAMHS
jgi:hypothetical protein